MRYLGGKTRQAKDIKDVINKLRGDRSRYIEPFIGGGSVFSAVAPLFSSAIGADLSPSLICLWHDTVKLNWCPPDVLSRDEWMAQKLGPDCAMRAWAGYAASYNGKWFAGYGPTASGRDYLSESLRGLLRKAKPLRMHNNVSFVVCDYSKHDIDSNTVVYCDPPYADTEQYGATLDFDHTAFWRIAEQWSRLGALVLVHEYTAPDGWHVVHARDRVETMHHGGPSSGPRSEKLFMYRGNEEVMSTNDTSSFFTSHQTRDVPRDQWGRYKLPGPDGAEMSYTRATTLAATLAEQYGLSIWKQRQVVWGLSRRPDLMTMASTIAGPEDKKALGAIVDEAHIAGGTQAKANKGSAIHKAIEAAERGHFNLVPEDLRIHVSKYFAAMKAGGLTVLPEFIERTVIIPDYDTAGTFDNLVRCPDGKIRVSDKKTGRMDYSDTEFAVQMALYANASAMFNYDTGRYEPLPDIAKDYAILAHIDPETGHTELQRVNIEWGWVWARTCAEVMAIRKTKGVITPYVPPADNISAPQSFGQPAPADLLGVPVVVSDATSQPVMVPTDYTVPAPGVVRVLPDPIESGFSFPAYEQAAREKYGATAQVTFSKSADGQFTATVDPSSVPNLNDVAFQWVDPTQPVPGHLNGTVPGGFVDSTSSVPSEIQAFWSDDRHDTDPEVTESVNGVPIEQYGNPNRWPCADGQDGKPCEFTGTDGLHSDGTVCLYGNQRPGPITPLSVLAVAATNLGEVPVPPARTVPAAEYLGANHPALAPSEAIPEHVNRNPGHIPADANPDSGEPEQPDNVDELIAKIDGLKTKAMTQAVVRELMNRLGIKEGEPGFIKLNQYKINMAKAAVTLAHKYGAPIVGPNGENWGVPTGPAPTGTTSGKQSAPKAVGAGGAEVSPAVRTAVASIRNSSSIAALKSLHDHYANKTEVGWTEEMQNAARTRALELEGEETGEQPLTPMQMIEGATSKETLQKAWNKATDGGKNRAGWTTELNEAAIAKQSQLGTQPAVATTGNQ